MTNEIKGQFSSSSNISFIIQCSQVKAFLSVLPVLELILQGADFSSVFLKQLQFVSMAAAKVSEGISKEARKKLMGDYK